jgi:membrane-bound serine protease (ClpP class)
MPGLADEQSQGDDTQNADYAAYSPSERKAVNDAEAYIESLAQLRGRNGEWAAQAVRDGASLTADDALKIGVIEVIASSVSDLLAQIDGRVVQVGQGEVTLKTAGLPVRTYAMDWRSEFLGIITNPNVAYILMLVGVYGLLLEFYNPGGGLPGITGAISLLLALYAFQALPISYAGLALILLGIALMTAEAFSPSFGVLGVGGLIAFIVGSVLLIDSDVPAYQIALPVILGVAAFSAGILVMALGMMLRARQRPVVTGIERLIGTTAVVQSIAGGAARVSLDGELWTVACEDSLAPHDTVTVDAIDGLTLRVSKHKER